MKSRVLFGSWALVMCSALAVSAGTVSLPPVKDNTLIQTTSSSGQLSNGTGDIFIGRTAMDGTGPTTPMTSIRRGLIQFDLDSIPNGATITGATLTMRSTMGNNNDQVATLHRTLDSWGEGTSFSNGGGGAGATDGDATWYYRSYNAAAPGSSDAWSTPGGDFVSAASASTLIPGGSPSESFVFSWSSLGMIEDLQFWLDNPLSNFGWVIRGNEAEGQTAKRLNSRTTHATSDLIPQLVVTYVPEPASMGLVAMSLVIVWAGAWPRRRNC